MVRRLLLTKSIWFPDDVCFRMLEASGWRLAFLCDEDEKVWQLAFKNLFDSLDAR